MKSRISHDGLVGQIFGDWVIVQDEERDKRGRKYYICRCLCGNVKRVLAQNLLNGRSRACGCSRIKCFTFLPRNASKCVCSNHVRRSWFMMLHRCYNVKYDAYSRYGGSGVTVCERWFYLRNFVEDMGDTSNEMTIDRISSFGNYEPENCRWATRTDQNRNKKYHYFLEYNRHNKLLVDWARDIRIPYATLVHRYNAGWSAEKILMTPVNALKRNRKAKRNALLRDAGIIGFV